MKTTVATATLALTTLATPAVAQSDTTSRCNSRECDQRVATKQCAQHRVAPCIRAAAIKYRVSLATLTRKARCESSLNPRATNGYSDGLFQFIPSTWRTTPYGHRSVWSAKWNALAAGWMHRQGRGSEWVCI